MSDNVCGSVYEFNAPTSSEALAAARDALGDDAVLVDLSRDAECVRIRARAGGPAWDPRAEPAAEAERIATACASSWLLARDLIEGARAAGAETALENVACALARGFSFAPLHLVVPGRRPTLLLGAPGAGKTATAAKLLLEARLQGRAARLITLDAGKCGGLEQARGLAGAIGAAWEICADVDALARAVERSAGREAVAVDATGMGPFETGALAEARDWIGAAGALGVLVEPAGRDPGEAADGAHLYAQAGAAGMIVTKLDASRRLGGALEAARAGDLAFVGLCAGAEIASGVEEANPVSLARWMSRAAGRAPAS